MSRAYFEDGSSKVFYEEGKQSLRLRLIFKNGEPKVGISEFYLWHGMWRPGQRHLFISPAQWTQMCSSLTDFNALLEKGKSNHLERLVYM